MGVRVGRLRVHIDEIVLHGFAAGGRYDFGAALEQELIRLVSGGVPAGWQASVSTPALDAGDISVRSEPRERGTAVARAVYGAVRGTGRDR